jgi:chromosomal replication initiation ATPase DnaA
VGEVTKLDGAMPGAWRDIMKRAESDPDAFRAENPRPIVEEHAPPDRMVTLRSLLIPERFHAATFTNYVTKTASQRTALRAVQSWVGYAEKGQPAMLALIGVQGTGKSHLLYAALSYLIGHGLTGSDLYSRPWYRLADELRYGAAPAATPDASIEAAAAVRARLWEKRIVFLDEVRATASTAFDDTELAKFACHAYDKNLAVLISTNVSPLADVMGPAAASRFTQVTIDGPDARQEKQGAGDRQLPKGDQ